MARRKLDLYETGDELIGCLARSLNWPRIAEADTIWEPCAGPGAIVRGIKARLDRPVVTNDVDPTHSCDYTMKAQHLLDVKAEDAVVTNPPFNEAPEIVPHLVGTGALCCFLLRLSFLEPTKNRSEFLVRHPPCELVVCPRYSFTGNGKTDSVTCAWMIWNGRFGGISVAG